jgi:hypothetical protein
MNTLTLLGFFAVSTMLVLFAIEKRNAGILLVFGLSCVFGALYGLLQGAWLFGLVEGVWALVALRRCWLAARSNLAPGKPTG